MRGHRNHAMMDGTVFVGKALTRAAIYTMHQHASKSSPGNFTPGVREQGGSHIAGEVYLVNDEHLAVLDDFEDEGTEYIRKNIRLDDGSEAGIYILVAPKPPCKPDDPLYVVWDEKENAYSWRHL